MRTNERKHPHERVRVDVQLRGRRTGESAPNSLKFLATIEGEEFDGHVRGANGIKWRVA